MISYFQKFTSVISKWIGKASNIDGQFGYQCVDFARQYCSDVGRPIGKFSGSAYNGWKTGSPFNSKWKKVVRGVGNIPSAGDVVFFSPTSTNPFGHVAIVDNGCTQITLRVIEQNAGSGNGDGKGNNAIRKRETGYSRCCGWYTYIG